MKVHITNLYGQASISVALMAQNMVADIAKSLDIKEIGIYSFDASNESVESLAVRFDGMNAAVGNGDVIIFQSPSWNGSHFDHEYLKRLKIYSGIKIVVFIHDVHPLMFSSNYYLMPKVIETYNLADLVIVPSQKMLEILRSEGLTVEKTLIQEMWDHTTDVWIEKPKFNKVINFAGSPQRFTFIKDWQSNIKLKVFSYDFDISNENVEYQGWKFSVDLLRSLNNNGGFGLVWSQSLDSEYYKANVSYKLSTYLAAGLPVIVPKTLSNAHIVEKYNLGFVVDSLDEISHILEKISEEEYNKIIDNVFKYRELLIKGYITKKLLIDAIHEVML